MAKPRPLTQNLGSELVPIDLLKPYKGNARIGDVAVIRESLRANGQYRPIVVRRQTREILAGNHTWKAAKAEGWTEIWVTFLDCDAQTARRINLVDNRSAELGTYDEEALVALLGELPSFEGTGWSQDELQKLLGEAPGADGLGSDVPDDDYESQLGVIVLCEDQGQQQHIYETLGRMLQTDTTFAGAELKIVAV